MTNKYHLSGMHGFHSSYHQEFKRSMVVTGLKVAAGLLVTWLLVTLLMVL